MIIINDNNEEVGSISMVLLPGKTELQMSSASYP